MVLPADAGGGSIPIGSTSFRSRGERKQKSETRNQKPEVNSEAVVSWDF